MKKEYIEELVIDLRPTGAEISISWEPGTTFCFKGEDRYGDFYYSDEMVMDELADFLIDKKKMVEEISKEELKNKDSIIKTRNDQIRKLIKELAVIKSENSLLKKSIEIVRDPK